MVESKFNIYYTTPDGTQLLFNSVSCALAIVDEKYVELVRCLPSLTDENVPENLMECYQAAKEGHLIVETDYDEMLDLTTKRKLIQYKTDELRLTIAPTLGCNFKCIYCYEEARQGLMSKEVQDSLVDFVENQSKRLRNLSVTWYGGEPLLAKNIIYDLSKRLINICNANGIAFEASMVSNGSLLDDETIKELIEYKVDNIQITIDGTPETHNKRRISKSGQGSFDTIIDNINKILKTEKISVGIRINVDKSNKEELPTLLKILSDRLISKNVFISFGQVKVYTKACLSVEKTCYTNPEFAIELFSFQKLLEEYGFTEWNDIPYPQQALIYCGAERLNTFVVDPQGFLYKCWNVVGMTQHAVGNITDKMFEITNARNGYWMQRSPMKDSKCKECKLIPVCMGGCPYNDMIAKTGFQCEAVKYNLKHSLLEYYKKSL